MRPKRGGRFLTVAFPKEFQWGPSPLLSRIRRRRSRLKVEAMEVAKAKPACFNGIIRIRLRMMLRNRVMTATLTGVFISFLA